MIEWGNKGVQNPVGCLLGCECQKSKLKIIFEDLHFTVALYVCHGRVACLQSQKLDSYSQLLDLDTCCMTLYLGKLSNLISLNCVGSLKQIL